MGEFTARFKASPQLLDFLKKYSNSSKSLTLLRESFWKPKGTDLEEFPPNKKVIRLRAQEEQPGEAVIDELNFYLKDDSYTHDKIRLFKGSVHDCEKYLEGKDYERWVEIRRGSTNYKVKLPSGQMVNALEEEINGRKTFIKFEAESEKEIKELMRLLNFSPEDLILKNRAQLLAEERGLI